MTITEFLLARIAEDERIAEAASGIVSGPAQFGHQLWTWGDQRLEITKARVLAECKAKRRIVGRHSQCDDVSYGDASTCPEMRTLAAVYADHPDYDPGWAL